MNDLDMPLYTCETCYSPNIHGAECISCEIRADRRYRLAQIAVEIERAEHTLQKALANLVELCAEQKELKSEFNKE